MINRYYEAYGDPERFCQTAFKLPFADYIRYCQTAIGEIRQQAGLPHDEQTILLNSPFELRPEQYDGQNAVLLVHGFLASPYIMRSIAQYYFNKGYLVRAILLPGHGSSPGELLKVRHEQWQDAVEYGIKSLQTEAKAIHLVGYSMGAILASLAAYQYPIASIVMLAPAHAITWFANLVPLIIALSQLPLFTRYTWLLKQPQDDLYTYHSHNTYAVNEVQKLIKKLQQQLSRKPITAPSFIVVTAEDSTVIAKASVSYFKYYIHPNSHLLLYSSKPIKVSDKRIQVVASNNFDKTIRELSHVAIPVAPEDQYYGRNGKYYGTLSAETSFGEKRKSNDPNYRRLTFNPAYQSMLVEIDKFYQCLNKTS